MRTRLYVCASLIRGLARSRFMISVSTRDHSDMADNRVAVANRLIEGDLGPISCLLDVGSVLQQWGVGVHLSIQVDHCIEVRWGGFTNHVTESVADER